MVPPLTCNARARLCFSSLPQPPRKEAIHTREALCQMQNNCRKGGPWKWMRLPGPWHRQALPSATCDPIIAVSAPDATFRKRAADKLQISPPGTDSKQGGFRSADSRCSTVLSFQSCQAQPLTSKNKLKTLVDPRLRFAARFAEAPRLASAPTLAVCGERQQRRRMPRLADLESLAYALHLDGTRNLSQSAYYECPAKACMVQCDRACGELHPCEKAKAKRDRGYQCCRPCRDARADQL